MNLSRREALVAAGLAGAGLTLSGCRLLTAPPPASPAPTASSSTLSPLAKAFEERYNVRLITRALNHDRRLINPGPDGRDLVIDWDDERIQVLDETFRLLPETFYRGRIDRRSGEPLYVHLGLVRQVDQARGFPIAAEMRPYFSTDPVVLFLIGSFPVNARGRAYSRSVIVHELTHKVSNLERRDSYEALFRPTGMRTQADLERVYASIITRDRSGRLTFESASAYGAYNMEEHGAVASEHYFLGREVFFYGLAPNAVPELGMLGNLGYYGYARFLGEEQTALFYEALKTNLYEGREYRYQRLL
ncbi:MAG: hypothetical protein RMM58_01485 [Chloroflexota bacterium]|nr:hypothetical protein [Dehalococcoidia bacterium]MDW8252531.1 hypothetical protein [Chloroflexota bacterium]